MVRVKDVHHDESLLFGRLRVGTQRLPVLMTEFHRLLIDGILFKRPCNLLPPRLRPSKGLDPATESGEFILEFRDALFVVLRHLGKLQKNSLEDTFRGYLTGSGLATLRQRARMTA